ncbi:unnamed protein product [Closterium sp. NIES-54]
MAAHELRWLTYLLTNLGEQPRSPPVLYVDNKAMIALCEEHRLEHRTKHIALRYFLAQESQQRGQLLLADVATRANNADIFTKALPLGDLQRFSTMSLPPLPPSPAPPCLPCVEGRQRAAPHFSFPPTTAPLQTLHMDVWGPACVSGQGCERYFLLVVDDYTRYTTVFPLRSKGQVVDVLIPWIRTICLQLRERFRQDLRVLHLHSDRGGEFSSDLLGEFCHGEGILQSFMLPASPQKNGIAERCIGLVMEFARTSMIHATAPHFPWPFAVRYAAHQLNLWPSVSLPETSPTLRWTGKVSDASVFRVWGSCAFVRDTSADKLFARAIPCGPAPSGVSQVGPLLGSTPLKVAVGSGAARGAASGGAEPGGAESEGAGSGGAKLEGVAGALPRLSPQKLREWLVRRARLRRGATEAGGAGDNEAGGAGVTAGAGGNGGSPGVGRGGACTRGTKAAGSGGVGGTEARDPTEPGAAEGGGSGTGGAGAGGAGGSGTGARGAAAEGAGVGGTGAGRAGAAGVGAHDPGGTSDGGAGAVDPRAGGAGGTVRPRSYFVPLLQQFLGVPSSTSLTPPLLCPPPDQSQLPLLSASPLPAPSPYTEKSGGLTERREPTSHPVSPVRTARRVPRSRPPPVPGAHSMALCPSSVPLRVPLPAPPESSLPAVPDPESDRARATSPTISRLLATAVTDPSFESAAASALSESTSPPSVRGECALGPDVLEDRQEDFDCLAAAVPRFASMLLAPEGDPDAPDTPTPRSYAEAITCPYSSQWQAAMDAEMASWKSTGTYVDEVPPHGANIVDGMEIFRVKRPPGSLLAFKARYVA